MRCIFKHCQKEIEGFGNSARPFEGVCCDKCNQDSIIPIRMMLMTNKKLNNPESLRVLRGIADIGIRTEQQDIQKM
jgi:hypothetical protein